MSIKNVKFAVGVLVFFVAAWIFGWYDLFHLIVGLILLPTCALLYRFITKRRRTIGEASSSEATHFREPVRDQIRRQVIHGLAMGLCTTVGFCLVSLGMTLTPLDDLIYNSRIEEAQERVVHLEEAKAWRAMLDACKGYTSRPELKKERHWLAQKAFDAYLKLADSLPDDKKVDTYQEAIRWAEDWDLDASLAEMGKELAESRSKVTTLNDDIEALQKNLKQVELEKTECEDARAKALSELDSSSKKLAEKEKELYEISQRAKDTQEKLDRVESELVASKSNLDALKVDLQKSKQQVASLHESIKEMKQSAAALQKACFESLSKLAKARTLHDTRKALQDALQKIDDVCPSMASSIQSLMAELDPAQIPKDTSLELLSVNVVEPWVIVAHLIVKDKQEDFIRDLKRKDFSAFLDGHAVEHLFVAETRPTAAPTYISLCIDLSRSVSGMIEDIKHSAKVFVNSLPSGVQIELIGFSRRAYKVLSWTEDKETVLDAIDSLSCGQKTAIFDALAMAYDDQMAINKADRSIVLLTDGQDTASSKYNTKKVLTTIQRDRIPVYIIALDSKDLDKPLLGKIATESGGEFFMTPEVTRLAQIYRKVAERIAPQYRITLPLSQSLQAGRHTLRFVVGGVPGLRVEKSLIIR